MKAATGELNLTLVTVLAIGAILAFFWAMWPGIRKRINEGWDNIDDSDSSYVETVEVDYL